MRYIPLIACIISCCFFSCARVSSHGGATAGFRSDFSRDERRPWSNQVFRNDPSQFQFAVVADRTGGARAGVFEEAIRKINLLCPEFVINVGDMIEGYNVNRPVIEKQFDEVDALAARFDMPFFMIPGNHDLEGEPARTIWKERYGRTYYQFVYKDVLFLCLDSVEGPGKGNYIIGDDQAEYFREVLSTNDKVRWIFVFLHVPSWTAPPAAMEKAGWAKMETLLKDRPHTVFAGHYHQYAFFERDGTKYMRLATTGGAFTNREGFENGVMDQAIWVTMTDKGPRFANLDLAGIYDEKWSTEESLRLRKSFDGSVSPILIETPLLDGASTSLFLNNRAALPAKVHLDLKSSKIISVKPQAIDVTVAPHTSETIILNIASAMPIKPNLADPISVTGTASYESVDSGIVEKTLDMSVGVVEAAYAMPRAKKPVIIDANLDEWDSLAYSANSKEHASTGDKEWNGPTDASFRFGVQRDEEFVYLGIEALDDAFAYVESDPDRPFYNYDGLSITFDVQPGSAASMDGARDVDNGLLQTWFTPGEPGRPMFMLPGHLKALPSGSKAACIRTANGYGLEMSVPIAYIERFQGAPWKVVQINVQMVDADKTGAHPVGIILWRSRSIGGDTFVNRVENR